VVLDLGTGDGRAVLARAAAAPDDLVIGLDASAAAMAEASRRAQRRRIPNAMFLAAGVETLSGADGVLAGAARLVTVTFPWGSLLRGVLGQAPSALAGIAGTLAPGGSVEVLVSVVPSDGIPGVATLHAEHETGIRDAWAAAGLEVTAFEPASEAHVAASGSSWARRLRGGRTERPVWRLAASIAPCDRGTSSSWG
jgi:16S rRNA (adenine(1408)-N(1))-methyltransferase